MNKTNLTIKDSSLSFLVGFLLCQFAVVVATCIALIIYTALGFESEIFETILNTGIGYALVSLVLYLTMLCVFLFFNKKKDNKIFKPIKIKKLLMYILIAIVSFLSLYPLIVCVDSLLVRLGAPINSLPYSLTTKNYFISLVSLVVAPAICEELLFRGIIFQGLRKHGKTFAIIISSLMFSIYHMAISQTIYPILIGLLLGVIMYYEENIYYCIAIHLTNNFTTLTLSYFKISLAFNHWSYIILAIVLAQAFIATILYFSIKNNRSSEKQPLIKRDKIFLLVSLIVMGVFWTFTNFS